MIDKTRLDGLLFAILGDEVLVERWWNRPNLKLDNTTPIMMFENDPIRVRDYVMSFANLNSDFY